MSILAEILMTNRYNDARNLIISNRQDIVNDTMTSLSIFNPTSTVTAEDVGEMVDAVDRRP